MKRKTKKTMFTNLNGYLMRHKNVFVVSAAAFLLISFVIIGPLAVQALIDVNNINQKDIQERNYQITQAIMKGDYTAWSILVQDDQLKGAITQTNFSDYAAVFMALQEGRVAEANMIKERAGLETRIIANKERIQAIDSAIKREDYKAWRSLAGEKKPEITADNFSQYVQAYSLINRGLLSSVNEIQRNLGLMVDSCYGSDHGCSKVVNPNARQPMINRQINLTPVNVGTDQPKVKESGTASPAKEQ